MPDWLSSPLLRLPPPILCFLFFGIGLLLDWLLPWSPEWMRGDLAHRTGWLLVTLGAALGLGSLGLLRWRRTTVIPHGRPTRLVTTGPYALSRNPIYVALTAIYCGAALLAGRAWPLVLLIGPVAVINFVVIPFEEKRLGEAFGSAYANYRRRVRRWL